jgi:hypothetical protein
MDALNQQFASDKKGAAGASLPDITVSDHQILWVNPQNNTLAVNTDGSFGGNDVPKGAVGDKSAPVQPDFLKPQQQSAAIAAEAKQIETLSKQSLTGNVQAADQLATITQNIGGQLANNPGLLNSLSEQFAYDREHNSAIPQIRVGEPEAGLSNYVLFDVYNPNNKTDVQSFAISGNLLASTGDKLSNAIFNDQVGSATFVASMAAAKASEHATVHQK